MASVAAPWALLTKIPRRPLHRRLASVRKPVIQRNLAGTPGDQIQQYSGPDAVRRVSIRIHEDLDDHSHDEQCERGKPGRQAHEEQEREKMFGNVSSALAAE